MSAALQPLVQDYRGHQFLVNFLEHPHGVEVWFEVDGFPTPREVDNIKPDYPTAKSTIIDEAHAYIDELVDE